MSGNASSAGGEGAGLAFGAGVAAGGAGVAAGGAGVAAGAGATGAGGAGAPVVGATGSLIGGNGAMTMDEPAKSVGGSVVARGAVLRLCNLCMESQTGHGSKANLFPSQKNL